MKTASNLWKMKVYLPLRASVTLLIPVIVLFWQSHGLSMTEVMILQAVFSIVMLGLEVPSGYIADLYGRKKSLIVAAILLLLGLIVYAFSFGFWGFLLAETVFAVGASMLSGADSAMMYDTLLDLKREKEFKFHWGRAISFMMLVMGVASVAGGFLANYDLRWPIYVGIPFAVLSLVVAFSFREPDSHKPLMQSNYMRQLLHVIRDNIFRSPKMLIWSITNALLFTGFMTSLWLYNPYFEWVGLSLVWYGVAFALCNLVASLSSHFAESIERLFGFRFTMILLFIVLGLSYVGMAHYQSLWALAFIAGSQITRGVLGVLMNDVVNKQVESNVRATVLSGNSMIARILYSVVILAFGVLMDAHGVQISFYVLGASVLLAGVLVMGLLFGPASRKV